MDKESFNWLFENLALIILVSMTTTKSRTVHNIKQYRAETVDATWQSSSTIKGSSY